MSESSSDRNRKLDLDEDVQAAPVSIPWPAVVERRAVDPTSTGDASRTDEDLANTATDNLIKGTGPDVRPRRGEFLDTNMIPESQRGPLTGSLLEDRYLVKEKLGEGGMGVVYRAEHVLMHKEMALKVLRPEFGLADHVVSRFQREAQSVSRLDHPGIIHVNDFGRTKAGLLFLAMEYLEGDSLTKLIREKAPLEPATAVLIAQQILLALDHAHSQGVLHRDLKPDNVMLMTRGTHENVVKILDFGIAKITEGDGAAEGLTEMGLVFGTAEYLSPEQALGEASDARADVYTVGIILWEMLGGRRPFRASKKMELISKQISEAAPSLRRVVPEAGVPAALDRIVLKALEKMPEDRYQSAVEMFQALAGLEIGHAPTITFWPSITGPITTVTPVAPRRKSSTLVLLILLFLGCGVAAAWFLYLSKRVDGGNVSTSATGGHSMSAMVGVGAKKLAEPRLLSEVESLLRTGDFRSAANKLETLADAHPTDARVRMLQAHALCRRARTTDCLRAYRQAITLDPTRLADPIFQRDLYSLLTRRSGRRSWSARRTAMKFAERYLDIGGAEMLTKFANKWWEPSLVWRAVALLIKFNRDQQVDYVHAYRVRFRWYRSCSRRKRFITEILTRKDHHKFTHLLRRIATAPYFRRTHGGRVYNSCIQRAAKTALKRILGSSRHGAK